METNMESGETKPKKPRIEAEEVRPAKEHVNVERLNRILASADQKTAASDEEDEEEDEIDGQLDDGDLRPEFVERLASPKVDLVSFFAINTHIFSLFL